EQVLSQLLHTLTTQLDNKWDVLLLESLQHNSSTYDTLSKITDNSSWQVRASQQDVSPVITLPATWEEYFTTVSTTQQKHFTRLLKTIGAEDEITYRTITESDEISAAMESFIQLHKASGTEKAEFWTPHREAFFIELANDLAPEKLLKIVFLDVNEDPAASLLIFEWNNQFLLYNSGFNAYRYGYLGVGNAIILHTIREAISLKRDRYDFMRGDESYKFLFGSVAEPVINLTVTKVDGS
ncbi:MAG: GNAT family N-acetyltransferase, partial [bacterium]|nr:GNAT family N-acetyltransferase [bacterium]